MKDEIMPNETELIGKWIFDVGEIKQDKTCKRIENLIVDYLIFKMESPDGWYKLYLDPNDGRYWELSHPNSDLHGGGPPMLKVISDDRINERYN